MWKRKATKPAQEMCGQGKIKRKANNCNPNEIDLLMEEVESIIGAKSPGAIADVREEKEALKNMMQQLAKPVKQLMGKPAVSSNGNVDR
ncbi:hypothetical protein NDU88_007262 [Pleurodeles waltl]|uniref:Uncharacterized protein n=1 Tax=Pleurodeles waltl TaxID=8319 RepID=A0AAV7VSA5_PLEWA|nr:hypothetical protein NDU88_007262 [Pleurodeles waltl]